MNKPQAATAALAAALLPSILFFYSTTISLKKIMKLISQHLQIHNWSCRADRQFISNLIRLGSFDTRKSNLGITTVTGYLSVSKLIQSSESGRWFCHCNGTRGIWESRKFEMLPCPGDGPNQPPREQRVAAVTSTTRTDGVFIIKGRSAGNTSSARLAASDTMPSSLFLAKRVGLKEEPENTGTCQN